MNQAGTPLCTGPSPETIQKAEDAVLETMRPIARAIIDARAKHPSNRLLVEALAEELGEYAEELGECAVRGDAFDKCNPEALDVATVAARMFLEGVTPSPRYVVPCISTTGILETWRAFGNVARRALRAWSVPD